MNIEENVKRVQEKIAEAAIKCGRSPEEITLVAVTKTVDAACARRVFDAGVLNLGENRVQVFLDKYEVLQDEPTWHLIGHLQTNKVKYITGKVSLIHSVDSSRLAEAISRQAVSLGVKQDILVQFNLSGEESKSGANPTEAERLFEEISLLPGLSVRGLMTMGPLGAKPEDNRRVFASLRHLSEKLSAKNYPIASFDYLSMGMSGDFEEAIYEGANIIRVGSALFQ